MKSVIERWHSSGDLAAVPEEEANSCLLWNRKALARLLIAADSEIANNPGANTMRNSAFMTCVYEAMEAEFSGTLIQGEVGMHRYRDPEVVGHLHPKGKNHKVYMWENLQVPAPPLDAHIPFCDAHPNLRRSRCACNKCTRRQCSARLRWKSMSKSRPCKTRHSRRWVDKCNDDDTKVIRF